MKLNRILIHASLLAVAGMAPAFGQANTTTYTPGVTFQATNPNYLVPNPFYFEGRIDWNLLKITTPSTFWEFAQRGIYKQDDLEDKAGAIADYMTAWSMNSMTATGTGACQLISPANPGAGTATTPAPCSFTFRLRLGVLLRETDPTTALTLFNEVLTIDPLRLGVNALIAETYKLMAEAATDAATQSAAYQNAIKYYKVELTLSPVTANTYAVTYDEANNAHVHWTLAEIYRTLGDKTNEATELGLYLKASKWHSDTYAWRIQLAQKRLGQ